MRKLLLIAMILVSWQLSYAQIQIQWEHSGHADPPWTPSFAQGASSQNNNLNNCIRCHDGNGFVNFTLDTTTQTDTLTQAGLRAIDCATCHDQENNNALRMSPAGSDTLASGFNYATLATGPSNLCMDCHKGRRNAATYVLTSVSSEHWGPHYSVQSDIYFGKNAAEFGTPYSTGDPNAHNSTPINSETACIACHMQPTPTEGNPGHNLVGGHTFKVSDTTGGQTVNVIGCSCHGTFENWNEFKPGSFTYDLDGDGTSESVQEVVSTLLDSLKKSLPLTASGDTIDWETIRDSNDVNLKKAYFNWQMIDHDGSLGIHNPQYVVSVLEASLQNLVTSVEQVNNVAAPTNYILEQNYPNPFNPVTTIRFSIPQAANVTLKVYDAVGNEVATLHKGQLPAGTFTSRWNAAGEASGIYFYKLTSDKFNMTKKMILMK